MAKMRAILDARYMDFFMKKLGPGCNFGFCEYVFWWLGAFTVDESTRKVVKYVPKKNEDPQIERIG